MKPRTLFEKIWDDHVVAEEPGGPSLLYVDLHLMHEVTSPQAFDGLRQAGRRVRRPDLTVAMMDHNVPTWERQKPPTDPLARRQLDALTANCAEFGIALYDLHHPDQGIVHVVGPQLGHTQPGTTIVCGDSHTSTHGAFGALAFGIGTSEVEHVLATQTLPQHRPRTMEIRVEGRLAPGVGAKDLALHIIGRLGTKAGAGHVIEFTGSAVRELSMEGRMTLCNLAIEAGARAGMIAPDETTFAYLRDRPHAPKGDLWDRAVADWKRLASDPGAGYDQTHVFAAADVEPQVTWGTNPAMVVPIGGVVPSPDDFADAALRAACTKALDYMGLVPGTCIEGVPVDRVFIGSCTNGRLEDLRAAAKIAYGRRVAPGVHAMVVPGSTGIKRLAEAEGLDRLFRDAGFDWRESGCSICLGMNPDTLKPGERCASTSNRNFEGRQGKGGRTHLVGPEMAAAAAIAGHLVDHRKLR